MSILKGWMGEKISQFGLWLYLDKAEYKRWHGLILETANGTTQIDHVYLSRYGVFVVETKHMGGWIFGSEKAPEWTQRFKTGASFKFQNPLRQNYKHVKAVSESLAVAVKHVHSVIIFIGDEDTQIKTKVPENVTLSPKMAAEYIKRAFTEAVFTDEQLRRLESMLDQLDNGEISNQRHTMDVQNRYAQKDKCPKCGSALVRRTAKTGRNKGGAFMACSAYPKCRFILDE